MYLLLTAISVLGFPALAVWAYRGGGTGRLWLVTGISALLVLAAALLMATARFGNRLAVSRGYGWTAPRVVLFVAVGTLLPLLLGALAIDFFAKRGRGDIALYLTALVVLILARFSATILLLYLRSSMP